MNYHEYLIDLLGKYLADLSPLIARVVEALDKEGTRDLRNRIDSKFYSAVFIYELVRGIKSCRDGVTEWYPPRTDRVIYDRAIPLRSGGGERRKEPPRHLCHLTLVGGTDMDGDLAAGRKDAQ